ncbi:ATP synthase F1 subunit delta [Rubripirellula reticaptiva]|uniref:ATP synthase subunit delta n=1 Tax=Rubripirellula reticaptiva TaxID=2528013 RepID=A0A5C6F616_9BACT|nr:ATP synthase F1 subunit delta [Rubripirellula reticaptiva]TWU55279.1 ATP synthase subunit delta [Rubripirellula reticaptiva]
MTQSVKHDTVLDTGAEQLGKTYARALIGAAKNQGDGVAETIVGQLSMIVDQYLAGSPQLRTAFASPRVSQSEKNRIIDRIFGDELHPTLLRFLKVMVTRDRLGYIAAVRNAADTIFDDMMGRVVASVRTAVPLDDETRNQIANRLGSVMNAQIKLNESVDPELIGGMVIRIGDKVFDSSVKNRLDKLAVKARQGFSSKLLERFEHFTSE